MPRHKKSDVWENYIPSSTNKSVKCKHCDKVYQFGNVSKMTAHLFKCFKCPLIVKHKLKSTTRTNIFKINFPFQDSTQQEENDNSFIASTTTDTSTDRKLYLDRILSKAIFATDTPLSIVEPPLWKQFFEQLQPLYKPPSMNTIATQQLESIHSEMLKKITEELKFADYLHLQCDGWSNQRDQSNINFVIAKPEPVFLKRLNITNDEHANERVSKEILEIMTVYGSQKFITLIGDNTSNVQKAFQLVKDTHAHVLPLICVAHTLNLLCKDCLKPEPIKSFISLVMDTMKAVNESVTVSALLAQIVKSKGSGETLKWPDETQWSSYCTTLKSIKKSKLALQTLAVHKDSTISAVIKSNLLDVMFWSTIENCIKLLEPITDKIVKIEENQILFNEVYVTFKEIASTFLNDQRKEEIINAIIKRTNNCLKPIHFAAHLLDPRSQGISLKEEHEVDAMEYIYEVGQSLIIEVAVDLANYRAKQDLWSKSFIWENVAEMNPVTWWKGLCTAKLLSKVAVRILTTPCTSAFSEQYFSTHDNIHSKKRNGWTTDREAKIAFIADNWHRLHRHDEHNDKDYVPLCIPEAALGPTASPVANDIPSTSRVIKEEIEFCDINEIMAVHYDSDSSNND